MRRIGAVISVGWTGDGSPTPLIQLIPRRPSLNHREWHSIEQNTKSPTAIGFGAERRERVKKFVARFSP
jgi:hypothetical protein